MFNVQLLCYPWDLEDEGIDDTLDSIQGQVGVDGVTIVAACEPIVQLRRRIETGPRIFRSDGGCLFQPDESKYAATRCKPPVSSWVKTRNPLAKIAHACRQRSLNFRARIDTRRIGRLVSRCPATAVKSAFGDPSPSCASLTNPDFTEFLRDLISDLLQNYTPSFVELRGLDRPFDTDLFDSIPDAEWICPAARELFGMSFCESSMQSAHQAGIDAEAARRSAQVTLSQVIRSGDAAEFMLENAIERDPILRRYMEHQRTAHRSLIESLAAAAPGQLIMNVDQTHDSPRVIPTSAPAGVLIHTAGPIQPYGRTTLESLLGQYRKNNTRCEMNISAGWHTSTEESALVRNVKLLAEMDLDGVTFDHLGTMTDRDLNAAKQALRFAKRSGPA